MLFRTVFLAALMLIHSSVKSQENTEDCRVLVPELEGVYHGGCKKGLANGVGEAKGVCKYTGDFKKGYPDGYGKYRYNDTMYHIGYFQKGIKEGKGEMHYIVQPDKPDSIVKGYWSGDIYQGKSYTTYKLNSGIALDYYDITPTKSPGQILTIQISYTWVQKSMVNLMANENIQVRFMGTQQLATRSVSTYFIEKFPVSLVGTLSSGESFRLTLYKEADWDVNFTINK